MIWNLFLVLSLANASLLRTQDRLVFWLNATFPPTLQSVVVELARNYFRH